MILFSDLVDEAGILKAVSRLEAANQKFADSAVRQNERVGQSVVDLKEQLVGFKSELGNLGKGGAGFAGIKEGADAAGRALKQQQAVIERNKQLLDLNAASVNALRARLKDLETEYNSLDRSQAGSQARMKAINSEIKNTTTVYRQLTSATNEAKRSIDAVEGSYAALDRQTKQLRADLQAMPNAFDAVTGKVNKHNQAAVEMLARIQANDKALKTASASMGQHQQQVGNYGLAIKGLAGELIGVTSVVGGITLAISAIKGFVEVASDMERVNNTLKAVSRDTVDFSQKQNFLIGLSRDLGYEYKTLADSYAKISASTKDTAVEGKKAQDVYRGFVVAGAALHLSNDKIERSLNAVQQMFDKTTVKSEELKTQLADSMPGAVKIFADALGISTRELNLQMEAGNLLAVDVLPKVAAMLEKTYGEAAKRNAEQYVGTIAEVKTEFSLLVDTLNQDAAVTGFFAKINRGISGVLRDVKLLVRDGDWKDFLIAMTPATLFSGGRAQRRANDQTRSDFDAADLKGRQTIMRQLQSQEQDLREQGEISAADGVLKLRRSLIKRNGELLKASVAEEERELTIAKRNEIDRNEQDLARFQKQSAIKRAKELNELEAQLAKDPKNEVLQHKLDVYDRLDQQATAKDKAAKDRIKSQKPDDDTQLEKIDKQIKSIEATLQKQAMIDLKAGRLIDVDPKLAEKVTKLKEQYEAIKAMQEAIEKGTYNKKVDAKATAIAPKAVGRLVDANKRGDALTPAEIEAADAKQLAKFGADMARQTGIMSEYETKRQQLSLQTRHKLKGLRDSEKEEIKNLLKLQEDAERSGNQTEVQNLQRVIEQKKALYQEDYQNRKAVRDKSIEIGVALVNGLFEIEQQASQNRMVQLDKEKERELANVGDNANAKAAIERKYDAQRKQLQHQQDVQARNQALFNIAVAGAVAVTEALPNIPLAVAVGILAAVQAGIVLAKPLPQYKDGKNVGDSDSYAGPALVGEAGRELWVHDGKVDLVDKATVVNVGRNDRILPNALTERLLSDEHALAASAILHRNRAAQQTVDQLAASRDAHQSRLLSRALSGGVGSVRGVEQAIKKGFEGAEVHQWRVSNGQLVDLVGNQHTRRTVQAKKHQLGK